MGNEIMYVADEVYLDDRYITIKVYLDEVNYEYDKPYVIKLKEEDMTLSESDLTKLIKKLQQMKRVRKQKIG
jgi:hypothetical protein